MLVGTISIEKSEYLSKAAQEGGAYPHNVLNAKQHEREAEIVAQAGKLGRGDHRHKHGRPRQPTSCSEGNAEYLARNDLKKAGYDDEGHSRGHGLCRHGQ